jgi:hypothetical protein
LLSYDYLIFARSSIAQSLESYCSTPCIGILVQSAQLHGLVPHEQPNQCPLRKIKFVSYSTTRHISDTHAGLPRVLSVLSHLRCAAKYPWPTTNLRFYGNRLLAISACMRCFCAFTSIFTPSSLNSKSRLRSSKAYRSRIDFVSFCFFTSNYKACSTTYDSNARKRSFSNSRFELPSPLRAFSSSPTSCRFSSVNYLTMSM